MRLARDTRQTLGLAIEALLELLDAIGSDPEAEPSLAVPEQVNQSRAWSHPGNRQELEEQCEDEGAIEQDCIPGSEDELPRVLRFDQAQVVAANKQDAPDAWEIDDVRHALRLDSQTKLLPCVATDRPTVKNVLLELLYSIIKEMESGK